MYTALLSCTISSINSTCTFSCSVKLCHAKCDYVINFIDEIEFISFLMNSSLIIIIIVVVVIIFFVPSGG